MRFLVDAQLPPLFAVWLSSQGHEGQHVIGAGLQEADDDTIWNYAKQHDCIIVTKDEDFSNRAILEVGGPQVVWLRLGNCSNRALTDRLHGVMQHVTDALNRGDRLVEIS